MDDAFPEVFRACMVDYNRIWAVPDAVLIQHGQKKYKTLEEIRKEFQWELHGQVLPYDKKRIRFNPSSRRWAAAWLPSAFPGANTAPRPGPCWPMPM